MIAEGAIDEKVSIHRRPDNGDSEAARGRCSGCRHVSRAQHQYSPDLLVALEVWRHGRIDDGAAERAGS